LYSYVALLRSINVAGHHIIKMADLRNVLDHPDLSQVATYLQSGNVVFKSSLKNTSALEELFRQIIESSFGYDIQVKVIEETVFLQHFNENPFLKEGQLDTKKMYFVEIIGHVDQEAFKEVTENNQLPETMILSNGLIYVYYVNGYGRSKVSGSFFEKKLHCHVTARNFNTMKKLCEMLKSMN